MEDLVTLTPSGLYCEGGGFYLDPWEPVDHAVISHAHGDHARPGNKRYLCTAASAPLLRHRLGEQAQVEGLAYGERLRIGRVIVSLHPAGHILGSAQVRIEGDGRVLAFTGDYKRAADPTCTELEVLKCDALVSEATFALPIYRWDQTSAVVGQIWDWWRANRQQGRASVLFCYALGKAQRILAELSRLTDQPVFAHGAIDQLADLYRQNGARLLPTRRASEMPKGHDFAGELILAPPTSRATPWLRRFGDCAIGFASGWMRIRGERRRQGFDRGFALSDHADWPALLDTIRDTGAQTVRLTHGHAQTLAHFLSEQGVDARALEARFNEEAED